MGFTDKQKLALDVKDRTLLISAGAGSGKTTTLIRRIIDTLTDATDPADITELLIVTFTNAAVEEIRARVEKALGDAIGKQPQNAHLQKQLALLSAANIMTIDSLCQDFLKQNAEALGLLPNYRIADSAEAALLASDVMETVLSGFYDGAYADRVSEKDFLSLTDMLVGVKNSETGIGSVLLSLYEKTQSHEKGVFVLSDIEEKFPPANTPEETTFGAYIVAETKKQAENLLAAYRKRLETLHFGDPKEQAWAVYLGTERDFLDRLTRCDAYAEIRDAVLSYEKTKAPGVIKKTATDTEYLCRGLHQNFQKTIFDGTLSSFFVCSAEDFMETYGETRKAAKATAAVLSAFDERFRAEKKRLGICEYSDLERYFYESLWKDGERTPTAELLREQYRMIFIDEYQDINPLQHKIFEALAKDDNRFMVGDIKQSIYGFRSADPTIFAGMKKAFPLCDAEAKDKAGTIFMSENFRSDEGIVRTVNEIFGVLFDAIADSIGYVKDEEMIYRKNNGAPLRKSEVTVLEWKAEKQSETADESDRVIAELKNKAAAEAYVMADKVMELCSDKKDDGTPICYGDIVVLMRNGTNMQTMIDVFEQNGIPCRGAGEKEFFKSPSVLLAIALLNAIDNPYRDIYLSGVMMSPIYGFSPDDMTAIREEKPKAPLYVSLLSYAEKHGENEKAKQFLSSLCAYRTMSEGTKLEELLFRLYHETGLLSLAVRNGEDDNLWILFENARKFEHTSYQGLGAFLRYVTRVLEKNGKFDAPDSSVPEENAVRFMTIHASKGLEFPVVFLPECATALVDRDAKDTILFSEELGFACTLYDETGTVRVNTPMREAVKHIAKRKMLDEEMRIFYVAMTRAEERLYLFACRSQKEEDFENDRMNARYAVDKRADVLGAASYLDWTVIGANESVTFRFIPAEQVRNLAGDCPITDTVDDDAGSVEIPADPLLVETLKDRFSYLYPDAATLGVPEKLSVSKLYPAVLDGTEDDAAQLPNGEPKEKGHREPRFLSGKIEDEAAKRGIATHAFLQFCDFERLQSEGAEAELSRLLAMRFLSEEDAKLVRMEEIGKFCVSDLARRMRDAKKLYRELRFHVRLPAEAFTTDEEKKKDLVGKKLLVQGVMDCVMENSDGTLTLVDYKTDRLPPYALDNPGVAAKILREKHERQLSYYKEAVRSLFGKYPEKTEIYSLLLGYTVEL